MTFAKARVEELPPSADGPQGQAIATVLGGAQDAEQALLTEAVLMRYPLRTPDDAINFLGSDSAIDRFDGEPAGTASPPTGYHGRLTARWKTWKKAGSAQAIIDSLNAYGIPDVAVYQNFDGTFAPGDWYSRFWIVLGPNYGTSGIGPLTMPFTLGSALLGSTATAAQEKAIKQQVLKWKSAHSYPVWVFLIFPDTQLMGLGLTMPFTLGATGAYAKWKIGRLFGIDTIMPCQLGGFTV